MRKYCFRRFIGLARNQFRFPWHQSQRPRSGGVTAKRQADFAVVYTGITRSEKWQWLLQRHLLSSRAHEQNAVRFDGIEGGSLIDLTGI